MLTAGSQASTIGNSFLRSAWNRRPGTRVKSLRSSGPGPRRAA